MYYYIMEPPKGKMFARHEKIKDLLGNLGIAGETVTPSAARTIEELANLGVMKGYSTIVAVGGESLVNKIITVLATQKIIKEAVLGIIPNDFDSTLAKKINVSDIRTACDALKYRKLETIDLCQIEPNKFFITEATLENPRNRNVFFGMDGFQGSVRANNILIKPGLKIFMHDKALEGNPIKRFINWLFGKKETDIFTSFFKTKRAHFEAENTNLAIKIAFETVAKTPVTIQNRSKVLKIIVGRDKIK